MDRAKMHAAQDAPAVADDRCHWREEWQRFVAASNPDAKPPQFRQATAAKCSSH
jgi:hypothetical protein